MPDLDKTLAVLRGNPDHVKRPRKKVALDIHVFYDLKRKLYDVQINGRIVNDKPLPGEMAEAIADGEQRGLASGKSYAVKGWAV
jgi:hypothetical protein